MARIREKLMVSAVTIAGGLGMYAVSFDVLDRHASQQADCIIAHLPHADEKGCQEKIETNFSDAIIELGGAVLTIAGGLGLGLAARDVLDNNRSL